MEKIKYHLSISGKDCYSLVHPQFGIIKEYQSYLESIASDPDNSNNSIQAKAQDLKNFFEYLYAFSDLMIEESYPAKHSGALPKTVLSELILSYPKYLSGGESASGIIGKIAAITKSKPKASASCDRMLSSVGTFIKDSAVLQANILSAQETGIVDVDVVPEILFGDLLSKRQLNEHESKAILAKSMLAGVISGGAKYVQSSVFSTISVNTEESYLDKAFPENYTLELLDKAVSRRDLCLWALLFGTGIRQSEGLQLLLTDIDSKNRKIYTIDPALRPASYAALSEEQYKQLEWKGRKNQIPFFLEPYKSIFFNNFPLYLANERISKEVPHTFVFIKRDGGKSPLFTASNAALNKSFKAAQRKLGFERLFTLHSTRHFYGVWCRNFLQVGDTYGLESSTVQSLMGHASENSTDKYAVTHKLLLEAKIMAANELVLKSKASRGEAIQGAILHEFNRARRQILGIE